MKAVRSFARPYLKPWYRVVEDGDRLILEYADAAIVLEGRAVALLLPRLLPLLDGRHTAAEIVDALGGEVEPAVANALHVLASHGVLTEGPPLGDDLARSLVETAHLYTATGYGEQTADEVRERLRRARIAVAGSHSVAAEIARLLVASSVGAVERIAPAPSAAPGERTVTIVAPAASEVGVFEEWNSRALSDGGPWLHVGPYTGRFAAVGPLFLPGETCCFECYRLRRRSVSPLHDEYWSVEGVAAAERGAPALNAFVAACAVHVTLRWVAQADRFVPGSFYAIEAQGILELGLHHVYRVPRCPKCSDTRCEAAPLPWYKEQAA